MQSIVLATGNPGKIKEFQTMLTPIECIPQAVLGVSDVDEVGTSFVENALLKAKHASQMTGKPALADDSGLVVTALGGAPGIYSGRFAGNKATDQDNVDLLLKKLEGLPFEARGAYFYCVIVVFRSPEDPCPVLATGRLDGWITEAPQGTHGFGYDPVFYVPSLQKTLAQLPRIEKNLVSHRASAMQNLLNPNTGLLRELRL